MDPDATLTDLRNLIANARSGWLGPVDMFATLLDVADSFDDLDEWISNGGFLPTDWNAKR